MAVDSIAILSCYLSLQLASIRTGELNEKPCSEARALLFSAQTARSRSSKT